MSFMNDQQAYLPVWQRDDHPDDLAIKAAYDFEVQYIYQRLSDGAIYPSHADALLAQARERYHRQLTESRATRTFRVMDTRPMYPSFGSMDPEGWLNYQPEQQRKADESRAKEEADRRDRERDDLVKGTVLEGLLRQGLTASEDEALKAIVRTMVLDGPISAKLSDPAPSSKPDTDLVEYPKRSIKF